MSSTVETFFKTNPLLVKYTQAELVNINSLARYIKNNFNINSSVAAIGMEIRRFLSKIPKQNKNKVIQVDAPLHIVTRTHLQELIFDKNNRQLCLDLFNRITKTKNFSCLIEGEKEIVLLTDYDVNELLKTKEIKQNVSNHTTDLGFISVDFSIKLRTVVGVYCYVTTALASANIPIHSFHTIGGEILILVKNEDLIKTQEVLSSLLNIL